MACLRSYIHKQTCSFKYIRDKVFKNGPSKICRRQPLKNLKGYGLLNHTISLSSLQRLSSTNFTWSILEYFVLYVLQWTPAVTGLILNSTLFIQMVSRYTYLKYFSHHCSTLESYNQMIAKLHLQYHRKMVIQE